MTDPGQAISWAALTVPLKFIWGLNQFLTILNQFLTILLTSALRRGRGPVECLFSRPPGLTSEILHIKNFPPQGLYRRGRRRSGEKRQRRRECKGKGNETKKTIVAGLVAEQKKEKEKESHS